MNCGVCSQRFVDSPAKDELIVLIRYRGRRVLAHYRDCSLSRDGAVLAASKPKYPNPRGADW